MDAADKPSDFIIRTGQDESVLHEHRRVGSGADDFTKRYPASRISTDQTPVGVIKRFAVAGKPLLWFNRDKTEVVCDQDVFPNGLQVADATNLAAGKTVEVGRIDRKALEELGILKLSEFLIRSCAVQTWVHLESTLTLSDSTANSTSFRGSHLYFTNQENNAPLAFTIHVDETGVITVTGDELQK